MAVSFSAGVKAELCKNPTQKHCCAVAECFGITPERVIQIENSFLRLVRRARRGERTIMDSESEQ